ncbi:MAG: glutathione S-transferase family protein [Pseudomonadales bacterium]|nr:glutathione S-transferase family protein [Pseudomonadales bacterium]
MITVHGVPLSPFVRKVLYVLEHKQLEYTLNPVFPGAGDEAFAAISPLGKIPVLEHDGFAIADSSVICRYLESQFPTNPIYPNDLKQQTTACWLEEFADTKLIEACGTIFRQRFLNPKMMNQPCDEAVVDDAINNLLPPLLSYLESVTPATGVLVGEQISIADIAVITCFVQVSYADYEVDASAYPKLRAYVDRSMGNEILAKLMLTEKQMLAG